MIHLTAQLRENHERFVKRVASGEVVWRLKGPNGSAECASNHHEGRWILMFWSDKPYAERARQGFHKEFYKEHEPQELALFDFLFRWLPAMSEDRLLAGTNYTADLAGLEVEPMELREQLLAAMKPEVAKSYVERLKAYTAQDNE